MSTDAVRAALAELATAEAHYRLTFQTAPSAGHLDVGRAWDRMRRAGDAARAALSEPVPSVPDGWQLVPKEPTLEMLRAAVQVKEGPAVYKVMSFAGLAVLEEDTKDEYTAALAAAPSPTAPPSTPNASLPPLGEGPRTKIQITVEVPADWANRLDMQWVLEREIHADRWAWNWPTTAPQEPTP